MTQVIKINAITVSATTVLLTFGAITVRYMSPESALNAAVRK